MMQALNTLPISIDLIKDAVKGKMDDAAYNSWVLPLTGTIDKTTVNFIAPNQFSVDFIKSAFSNILMDAAREFGLSVEIRAGHGAYAPNIANNDNITAPNYYAPIKCDTGRVNGFDEFLPSDENLFAITALKKLAAGPAGFNPLFIYGPSGAGKTLLASSLEDEIGAGVLRMTGAQFVSEYVRALTEKNIFAFKDYLRNCDTFILDDVQSLCGKRASTDEFLSLVMDLSQMGKNIVITSDAAPSMLSGFDRRVRSVLASGLSVDIVPPTQTVRKNMLTRSGVGLELAEQLAARTPANGHIVAGMAKKLQAYAELMGQDINLDTAEKVLADSLMQIKTPLNMVRNMCVRMGISFDDVASNSRTRAVVRARMIMFAALKAGTNLSLSEIGRLVGGRDHATVLYGLSQIEKMKQTDMMLAAEIDDMISECK